MLATIMDIPTLLATAWNNPVVDIENHDCRFLSHQILLLWPRFLGTFCCNMSWISSYWCSFLIIVQSTIIFSSWWRRSSASLLICNTYPIQLLLVSQIIFQSVWPTWKMKSKNHLSMTSFKKLARLRGYLCPAMDGIGLKRRAT